MAGLGVLVMVEVEAEEGEPGVIAVMRKID
jgi:hypothetical protein